MTRLRAGGVIMAMIGAVAVAELGIVASASAPIVGTQTWHEFGNVVSLWSMFVLFYAFLGLVGGILGRRHVGVL